VEGRQDSLHFCAVTTSRYFDEGNGNPAFSEPGRQWRPESDHLRPRPRGRYRHPNRAESARELEGLVLLLTVRE